MHPPPQTLLCAALLLCAPTWGTSDQTSAPSLEQLVPADKKLDPAWLKSLAERGEPQIYRGDELKYIGMPVGGLFAGHLYLGGDGKLWQWDIFNAKAYTGVTNYAKPIVPQPVLEQGFALKIGNRVIPLDAKGFSDVTFRGEYPLGTVQYQDSSVPLAVTLEAFSPFIPLNTEDSSLPATLMRFTVKNTSSNSVEAEIGGWLENAVGCKSSRYFSVLFTNRKLSDAGLTALECLAAERKDAATAKGPDVVFEDFQHADWNGWTAEGTAFGAAPAEGASNLIQKLKGFSGKQLANSFPAGGDKATGRLTSPPFPIEKNYINFQIAGGNQRNVDGSAVTGINLLVDGKVVRSATGENSDAMAAAGWYVGEFKGKKGVIQIVDDSKGAWGHIEVAQIVFANKPPLKKSAFAEQPDVGSLMLGMLDPVKEDRVVPRCPAGIPESCFALPKAQQATAEASVNAKLIGSVVRPLKLAPGESRSVTFLVSWFFPNLDGLPGARIQGRSYAARFDSAQAVAKYVAANEKRLVDGTRLWKNTWHDSTLPYWFLDRTFINTSILATSTSLRFKDGRYWAWEGVGNCAGTCGHVYYYGQAVARLFPEIEREQRENVDFKISQKPDGAIGFRGECCMSPAIDSQAGYILRALREHQMSKDGEFLKRIWPKVKLAMDWMIAKDGAESGMIHGNQHNTLDADWFGEVSWLSGVYQAALLASAEMADLMKEPEYAAKCRKLAATGREYMAKTLFNGEYYQNKVDSAHLDSVNSGSGCEIDQVLGQSWAFQIGLPRVFPKEETVKSLQSLWRYNFAPDVGPYRAANKPGRWYAMPGEAGLLMCTFPRADWSYAQAKGQGKKEWSAMYFNECMNGFEHQVAGHMLWEGTPELVTKGLAIERAIHDRYGAAKRNPCNEIECGDHYGRSMASYGVFLAACGYTYNGPKGHIGFAPRIAPENFKAAFTTAEGWGSYSQKIDSHGMTANLSVKWGALNLRQVSLQPQPGTKTSNAKATLGGRAIPVQSTVTDQSVQVLFPEGIHLSPGNDLQITLNP